MLQRERRNLRVGMCRLYTLLHIGSLPAAGYMVKSPN